MNEREKEYFLKLTKDRQEIATVLERRAVRGYKESVVDKYSDQAHFIYELLQNADDASATKVRFVLEKDRLIFAHNGLRHFSISDPSNEDEDSKHNRLGDINAITSIANSNKKGASIGKFGVGFKAVFQYTSTPYIYDPEFRFKIERFIVPSLLKDDFPQRNPEETLFVFPFNHDERGADEAFSDISYKLENLSFPILFLTNLKQIEIEFENKSGMYGKDIDQVIKFDTTTAEKTILVHNDGLISNEEILWMFSREDEAGRRYSVGFSVDHENKVCPVNEPAFCFFPTKEFTNLKFIVHAPFLLTDSREGILAGVLHNENMIKNLSGLAADSIEYLKEIGVKNNERLIDDSILSIVPIDRNVFSKIDDKRKISFLPFYDAIKEKFEKAELLPTLDGYVKATNAYWASVPQLTQIFSDKQLGEITNNKDARWVFVSKGRDETQRNNRALFNYLDNLVRSNISEDIIINGRSKESYYNRLFGRQQALENIKGITGPFIERQSIHWLHQFYKWLSETKHRTEIVIRKPIFIDQKGRAASAFDEKGELILFLPTEGVEGYKVVNSKLLENKDTYEFIKQIGIKEPSLKDQIYNIIIPAYRKSGEEVDTRLHFKRFFDYYCKGSKDEVKKLLKLIKTCDFLIYTQEGSEHRGKAEDMYAPTKDLIHYFESKPTTKFINIDIYKKIVGAEEEDRLLEFLKDVGVNFLPAIYDEQTSSCHHNLLTQEYFIDGLPEIINVIEEKKDIELSAFLWKQLCIMTEQDVLNQSVMQKVSSYRPDRRYKFRDSYQESATKKLLTEKNWIVNKEGKFVNVNKITQNTMSSMYDINCAGAESLMNLLDIKDKIEAIGELDENSYLSDEQREKIELANRIKALGIGLEDINTLKEFQEFKRQKEEKERINEALSKEHNSNKEKVPEAIKEVKDDERTDSDKIVDEESDIESKKEEINKNTSAILKDIAQRTQGIKRDPVAQPAEYEDDDDEDEDEYMPSTVDYAKKIERAKQKSAEEVDKITYFEELQEKVISTSKYSYSWFNTLLEMESINSGEHNSNSREVCISFAKVEREPNTKRTLVLKYPNQYIPQFMEDLADIPLVLHMKEQTKTIVIEVANIRSYTLRVKIKNVDMISDIDLSQVVSASIKAKSPAFLLEELREQFAELKFEEDFNMQENLCENIEFIFGPPGTGKTTHLAKNVLLPMMNKNKDCKVLVLTPTNKSADVLVKRIMEVADSEKLYEDWLVRFGATGDEEIEQSTVFKDKTFDIRELSKNVTVTTIARFPYDYFMPQGARIYLNGIHWDYIVIDEASMIPLANIIFPLYKKTPKKFIIAGDPFQIEPITSVDLWKDENIYSMVQLNSFVEPNTVPHKYKVELLTTQYRSVPNIGNIFSNFAYDGILKNYRSIESQRALNLGEEFGIKTLNIIKFPVSKYESIYRCKKLQHSSSYQIYSALFTFEYVLYLAKAIAKNNSGEFFRIGVIAPYRAQADMIEKLLSSEQLPEEIEVLVGTIHGFQGDECDIIFAVFNPPPSISTSKEMFLNKMNIINVSISRARDYLFVVMPDDQTENINNLRLVKKVEKLIRDTKDWNEFNSNDLEEVIFGDENYLENNVFSTSHQSVNVYGLPEKVYEVRTEDSAVDVQIHKNVSE